MQKEIRIKETIGKEKVHKESRTEIEKECTAMKESGEKIRQGKKLQYSKTN